MNRYLKGNYEVDPERMPKGGHHDARKGTGGNRSDFETLATTKLGGSIAFVALKDGFVWEEPEPKDAT